MNGDHLRVIPSQTAGRFRRDHFLRDTLRIDGCKDAINPIIHGFFFLWNLGFCGWVGGDVKDNQWRHIWNHFGPCGLGTVSRWCRGIWTYFGCWNGSPKRWVVGGIVHPPIGRKNTTYIPLIVLAEPGGWKMLPIPPFRGTSIPTIEYSPVVNYQDIFSRFLIWCHLRSQRCSIACLKNNFNESSLPSIRPEVMISIPYENSRVLGFQNLKLCVWIVHLV